MELSPIKERVVLCAYFPVAAIQVIKLNPFHPLSLFSIGALSSSNFSVESAQSRIGCIAFGSLDAAITVKVKPFSPSLL